LRPRLCFIVPGDPNQPTGGYRYGRRICAELRQRGWRPELVGLAGSFPVADSRAREAMHDALAGLPPESAVVIDGLAMGGMPEVIRPHRDRLEITALVHHPLADESGLSPAARKNLLDLESAALQGARRVIATSRFTANRLAGLGMTRRPAHVAEPGTDRAEMGRCVQARLQACEMLPEHLLCVASLVPRKGHRVLVAALAGITRQDWRCTLAGPDDRDPECARIIRADIQAHGLADRIEITGTVSTPILDDLYDTAGLFVLPSLFEGYGMVISEALARGLPVMTTDGGALASTVPDAACVRVPAGDSAALSAALTCWFDDAALRLDRTRGALAARARLCSWGEACDAFERALASPAADP